MQTEGWSAYIRSVVTHLRWNVKQTTSSPIDVRLAYERHSVWYGYYQRSVVSRFPLVSTTDDYFSYQCTASVPTLPLTARLLPTQCGFAFSIGMHDELPVVVYK
jgi:hypothetical protein